MLGAPGLWLFLVILSPYPALFMRRFCLRSPYPSLPDQLQLHDSSRYFQARGACSPE